MQITTPVSTLAETASNGALQHSPMQATNEELVKLVDGMPTFSQNVVRIMELTGDINAAPKDLVRLVEHDPILTIKVLKLVNSAYFGLSKKVTSVKQGVVYIGFNTIKNLAVSIAAMGALPRTNNANFNMDDYWLHSLLTASIAKMLAQDRGFPRTEITSFFLAGLLHDIGEVVFAQFRGKQYSEVLTTAAERHCTVEQVEDEVFGTTHAVVGALLAERWQLAPELVQCIRHHHGLEELANPDPLTLAVFVANQAAKIHAGEVHCVSIVEELPPSACEWLGIPLEEVITSLPNLESELENARSFVQVGRGG